ncbi:hypothetical protein [Couchioplanes azureus]|uniref:hypothetical protein n=1 Tax=Couchioplanes caeruleus TaxID=56438 RepID=UPI0016705C6A|nr:hypothetical protein [Couchioplanes caeruleus]GGQ85597.1 hypothetical protein GCM10010166_64930 [Couchioplanes caeruleus subsp. azureus]
MACTPWSKAAGLPNTTFLPGGEAEVASVTAIYFTYRLARAAQHRAAVGTS